MDNLLVSLAERLPISEHDEQFLEKITNAIPGLVTVYNVRTGIYLFVNKGVYPILGYAREEVLEGGVEFITGLVHPDDLPRIIAENSTAIAEAEMDPDILLNDMPVNFEYRLRHKNGQWRWVQTTGVIFDRDSSGKIEHVLNVSIDITERKNAEERLRKNEQLLKSLNEDLEARIAERTFELVEIADKLEKHVALRTQELLAANEDLIRSNSDLEQFAYVASHDLKEPIRMISSYTSLLSRKYQANLDGDAEEYIRFITEGASRMQNLINDLLDYSRIGRVQPRMETVNLADVIEQAKSMLHEKIEIAGGQIICEGLPDAMPGMESQLIQLFQNLIGNAIKFRSEKTPIIIVRCEREKDFYRFFVEDNGIGFEDKYADRVFVIFQRLHTRDRYSGTGIGLAICKKIVEMHGGRIEVTSQPGIGTTFHFTLRARY